MDSHGFEYTEAADPHFGDLAAELRAAYGEPPSELTRARHLRQISNVFSDPGRQIRRWSRAAVVVAMLAVLGSGGAAAVAGVLPGPIQHLVHELGQAVRVSVPPSVPASDPIPDPTVEDLREALHRSFDAAASNAREPIVDVIETPVDPGVESAGDDRQPTLVVPNPAPAATWSGLLCIGDEVHITLTVGADGPMVEVDGAPGSVDVEGGRVTVRFGDELVTLHPIEGQLSASLSECHADDDSRLGEPDDRRDGTWTYEPDRRDDRGDRGDRERGEERPSRPTSSGDGPRPGERLAPGANG